MKSGDPNLRRKNVNWEVSSGVTIEGAQLAVLMDIRDALEGLQRSLGVMNFEIRRLIPDKRKPKRGKKK